MNLKCNIKSFLTLITALTFFLPAAASAEEFEAALAWSKRVELSTPVNGVVQTVFAQTGKVAAKGEVLLQLDPRMFKADLKYAQARLKHMSESSQEAKRELDRQLDMYDRTMLSDHDLQIAKNNFTAAQSQLRQAQALLLKAKLQLEYSAVRAPFNALIIKITAVKGQIVAAMMVPPALVIVAEANRMKARFFIREIKLNDLVVNQGIKINVLGKEYQGKILSISLEPNQQAEYAVDVIFDSKDVLLRAGQKAKVVL